jgi:predicted DNA-binding transcriptional regulator AlpA
VQPLTLHAPSSDPAPAPPKAAPPAVVVQPIAPLLVGRAEAAQLCGVSPGSWDRHNAAGLVPAPRRLGGRPLWSTSELRAWVDHGCPPRSEWDVIREVERRRTCR